ncbi:MAG TPA: aminotransferase class I/II-fold pyridoxal phosphate-dependent enzyme [Mycobacteriales bacterium]|nr:aminotransferase class I/II-fold pyridoxal phosphate-dependent enzyme [Mycobacteriales bacterium]
MVSAQAARLVADTPAIAAAHFQAENAPYDPVRRPDGYLNLGTAENRLVWDLLEPRLATRTLTAADTYYAPLHGTEELRAEIARLLSGRCRTPVTAAELVVVSGATAALDILATALCDPGEAIVVPAPYYSAFDVDLVGRSGARLVPAPLDSIDRFLLTPEAVERAILGARHEGLTVRAVALSSPSNPVGTVYPAHTLRALARTAAEHDVDIITDEVYAHSVFDPESFVSLLDPAVGAAVDPAVGAARGRTHLVWGFAKDFGLPGFKVGVIYSPDPEVCAAVRALAYFAPTSTDTQAGLRQLLADHEWVDEFLAESRRRLVASHFRTTRLLAEQEIPFIPAGAGFSIWTDLRGWLPNATFDAERTLWHTIFARTRVSILPGEVFGCPEPGWFRLCHARDVETVSLAVTRLGHALCRR